MGTEYFHLTGRLSNELMVAAHILANQMETNTKPVYHKIHKRNRHYPSPDSYTLTRVRQ